ncbi:MAG TPA: hypothetical protein DIS66_00015 [Candidatus Omnitrophica bacterium]|nr:hypothetical protein [Candidatus Omnitrophota bacterium]
MFSKRQQHLFAPEHFSQLPQSPLQHCSQLPWQQVAQFEPMSCFAHLPVAQPIAKNGKSKASSISFFIFSS